MPFWAYMLHCRRGAFYAGHTDDLERRIGEHRSGSIPERRIEHWSRAKKLALIRGAWARISDRAENKYGPSPSSRRTGKGVDRSQPVHPEAVEGPYFPLRPHPAHPPRAVTAVRVKSLSADPNWLILRWRLEGAQAVSVPSFAGRGRADGLWRTTCFELFVRSGEGSQYAEFNLSPSERWAAYDFTTYRAGMAERPMPHDPVCTLRGGGALVLFEAALPRAALPPLPAAIGLSAVIEEQGGAKSYWALAHPDGAPDFHDPACLALTLAAPADA